MEYELKITLIIILGILSIIGLAIFGNYIHKEIQYNNFQITIENLSDEQKCLHICGFEWPTSTMLENYKFCVEKCDRISERSLKCQE